MDAATATEGFKVIFFLSYVGELNTSVLITHTLHYHHLGGKNGS